MRNVNNVSHHDNVSTSNRNLEEFRSFCIYQRRLTYSCIYNDKYRFYINNYIFLFVGELA